MQLYEKYYFPQMASTIRKQISSCEFCKLYKYERHANKPILQPTPIPRYPCEILHIDIFTLDKRIYLSCINKFTNFAKLFPLESKSSIHLRENLVEVLHYFTVPRLLVSDKDRGRLCPTVLNYLRTLGVELNYTPTQKSEINVQIERFNSTFLEIYRCFKCEHPGFKNNELVAIAVDRYNNCVHSVINKKPADLFFDRSARINYQGFNDFRTQVLEDVRGLVEIRQGFANATHNKTRSDPISYSQDDIVFVANKQIKTKENQRLKAEEVEENRNVTIKAKTGKIFHKSDLRN